LARDIFWGHSVFWVEVALYSNDPL
jgi:hypothetical protein